MRELESQLKDADLQLQIRQDRITEERAQLLSEKKRHLSALVALMAYRTTRRPRIVKILTFGIVRDKRDPLLLAQIEALQTEISEWR